MDNNMLIGTSVRLEVSEPKELAEAITRWSGDSEYHRLLDSEPANRFSAKKLTEWIEKDQEKDPRPFYGFTIRILKSNRMVGFVGLDANTYPHGDAFVGIGIGERDFWDKGYGTEAMRLILRFAFRELNLRRVSLDTFEYNPRAIRSYEKAGFVHEGRARDFLYREGNRWDLIFMGILREEWFIKDTG